MKKQEKYFCLVKEIWGRVGNWREQFGKKNSNRKKRMQMKQINNN